MDLSADTPVAREREQLAVERSRALVDRPIRLFAIGAVAWFAAFSVASLLVRNSDSAGRVLGDVVGLAPLFVMPALLGLAALRTEGRLKVFWTLLALGGGAWLLGDLSWSFYELVLGQYDPSPSVADGFYLLSYAFDIAALIVAFRLSRLRIAQGLLDAFILSVAIGFIGWHLLIGPLISGDSGWQDWLAMSYPLFDVTELVLLVTLALAAQRITSYSLLLVGASLLVGAVTDALNTYVVALHEYVSGGLIDAGWQAQALLLALAGLVAVRHERVAPKLELDPPDYGVLPAIVGVGLGLFACAIEIEAGDSVEGFGIAGLVVGALVIRLLLATRMKAELADKLGDALSRQERLAFTDPLTGLHNRRFLDETIALECQRHVRSGRSLGLLVLDLDHFKTVNDSHGHKGGDEVLQEVARRLQPLLRAGDIVARFGGEEFVVVLPETDPRKLREIGERCRRAVSDRPVDLSDGREVLLTTSVGGACLPEHARDAEELVHYADKALYRAKALGRDQVQIGIDDELELEPGVSTASEFLQRLGDQIDRHQHTEEQSREIARWARLVARELGLGAAAERRCSLAARFHDVGKIAVPPSVLGKDGELSPREWAMVHEHPAHGASLVSLVPELREVAPLIGDHHERPDGVGYPAGKRASEISLEAGVIAVCDAWMAMRSDRAYRAPLSVDEARLELESGKATQFLPTVVDAFLTVELRERLELEAEGQPVPV